MTDDELSEDPSEADHQRKAKRRQLIQALVAIALIVFTFGILLPQFIDYGAVWDAITSLSGKQLLILLALALFRIPIVAAQYASVIPGLTVKQSINSYLASNSVAEFTPPPADLAVRYGMYRSLGIDAEPASVGILLTGLFDNAAKLTIPVLALIALLLSGVDDTSVWEIAAIGVAALIGGTVVVIWAMKSEEFTVRVGQWLGRFISWFLVKFNRNPLEDMGSKAAGIRGRVGETLRARWPVAIAATIGGHIMGYTIMLAALRFVGVGSDEVDWVSLLVAYALVLLLTMLPLTPGGIGVAAVGYTAILAGGDPVLANLIAAASLLTRVFTWLLPMVIGFVPLLRWRRAQANQPTCRQP